MAPESTRARAVRVAVAWLVLAAVRLALLGLPLRRIRRGVDLLAARGRWLPPESAERTAARVVRVARFVPGAACLAQALAGQVLLAWHGQRAGVVRFGVRRDGTALAAHAWLEHRGRVVLGGPDVSAYAPLETPAAGHAR